MKITVSALRKLIRESVSRILVEGREPAAIWFVSPDGTPKSAPTESYEHENLFFILGLEALSPEQLYDLSYQKKSGLSFEGFKKVLDKEHWNVSIDEAAALDEITRGGWARVRLWNLPSGNTLSLGGQTLTDSHLRGLKSIISSSRAAGRPGTQVDLSQDVPPKVVMTTTDDVRRAGSLTDLGW